MPKAIIYQKFLKCFKATLGFQKIILLDRTFYFFGLDNPLNKIYVFTWSSRLSNNNYYLLSHVLNQSIVKGNNITPFKFLQKLEISDLHNILDLLPIFQAAHSLCFAGLGVTYWL